MGDQPEQYNVTVLGTVASERCLLAGEFVFLLDIEAVFLLDKETADIIYRCLLSILKAFRHKVQFLNTFYLPGYAFLIFDNCRQSFQNS